MADERPAESFPDGTKIEDWFYDVAEPRLSSCGKRYDITAYGAKADGSIYTREIQRAIDDAAAEGGVIFVPAGTYMTGALFFKKGVKLYLDEGAVLKGSDDVQDYPVIDTRIEGECCRYLSALINADHCDGFMIFGRGTIDGNGERSWRAFHQRRLWNPACTNKDEQRARLVFISDSTDVTLYGVTLQNSQFWTTHFYKCSRVKVLGCSFFSPSEPVKAPSTDAIDIDVCTDVLIKRCKMSVNDDSTVLKGGKGRTASEDENNGINCRILIEDCEYNRCHGILTCGSESVHNRNILMRRIKVRDTRNFLWLKMRPDTRQRYEYIEVRDAEAENVNSILCIHPWTQFAEGTEVLRSVAEHISMSNIRGKAAIFLDVEAAKDEYDLRNFSFSHMDISVACEGCREAVAGASFTNVNISRYDACSEIKSMAYPD